MFRWNWLTYVELFVWGGIAGIPTESASDNRTEAAGPDTPTSVFTPRELARLRTLKKRYDAQLETKYPTLSEDVNARTAMGVDERRLCFVRWLVAHHHLGEDFGDQALEDVTEE